MACTSTKPASDQDSEAQYASVPSAVHEDMNDEERPEDHPRTPLLQQARSNAFHPDYQTPMKEEAPNLQDKLLQEPVYFSHRQQAYKLLIAYTKRWLLTVLISLILCGVVQSYKTHGGLNSDNRHLFNAISTGLIIALSLNITASLKSMAKALKWRVLAMKAHPPSLFHLIITFDHSQINPMRIMTMRSHNFHGLRTVCLVWLLINIIAQMGLAALSFTWSMDAQTENGSPYILNTTGTGRTTVFKTISSHAGPYHDINMSAIPPANLSVQRQFANDYGVGAHYLQSFNVSMTNMTQAQEAIHFETDSRRHRVLIRDYGSEIFPVDEFDMFSDRVIYTSASCQQADDAQVTNPDDSTTSITFATRDGVQQSMRISRRLQNGTLYIADTEETCGPRCTDMYAFVADIADRRMVYRCQSEVTPVLNINTQQPILRDELQLPDAQARIIAGSLGWGRIAVDSSPDGSAVPSERYQAGWYPSVSINAPDHVQEAKMFAEKHVSAFPAAVMVVMNNAGPRQTVKDIVIRQRASDLKTKDSFFPVIGLMVAIQGLFALLTVGAIWYWRTIVHDDDPFAVAPLLHTVMDHVPSGSLRSGDTIAKTIPHDLIYTFSSADLPHVTRSVAINDGTYRRSRRFPNGKYM